MNIMRGINSIPGRLSRVTSSGSFISEVDGLRFVAIMPVLIQHLSERLHRYSDINWARPVAEDPVAFLASRGTIGVYIFFAISGFILCLPFAKHHLLGAPRVPLRGYLWRRVTRLEPPYLFWMTFFFLVLLAYDPLGIEELFSHWGYSLVYLHNLAYADHTPINPVAWSLEIEIQFYLLAPFLAAFFFSVERTGWRRFLLAASIVGFIGLQHLFGWLALPFKLSLLGQLQHFLVGFLMADLYLTRWAAAPERQYRLLDAAAVLAFFTLCFSWSEEWGKTIVFALALALLFWAGLRGKAFNAFLRNPWVAAIGGMCYTIYLIHLPLIEGIIRFSRHLKWTNGFGPNLLLQAAAVLPVVLAVSAVFYLLLEKPFMDKYWPVKLASWFKGKGRAALSYKKADP
ncbi:MAG: acyltransferase [Phaeodactylibacter sp.]|nr:acyltransferase [Phaeodactylibacter sp.]MCB9296633.1 acyltransferase [Lewinellaceae bacterium]